MTPPTPRPHIPDTGNMAHESKMPEPVAWLVCGGRTFVDRGFTSEDGARESVVKRNDGARIEPLYTAADLELAKQEATRQAMERGIAAIQALRDSHCADTQKQPDPDYACWPDSISCDLVVAWNDAIEALRALTHESEKRHG